MMTETESLPVEPVGEHRALVLGSCYRPRDLVDSLDGEPPELSNGPSGVVFIESPMDELVAYRVWRASENGEPVWPSRCERGQPLRDQPHDSETAASC